MNPQSAIPSTLAVLRIPLFAQADLGELDAQALAGRARSIWDAASQVVIVFFVSILVALVLARVARFLLHRAAARMDAASRVLAAVTLRALARSAVVTGFALGVYTGVVWFVHGGQLADEGAADLAAKVLLTCALGYIAYCLVDAVDAWLAGLAGRTESKLDDMLVPLVRTSLRATIVVFVLLNVAEVLAGRPITTILAGLGIGSIAVGLAAQDTIKNFFGSIMLFSDRPFEMGDRIVVDGADGTVENVGFRSTRVRTADGHLVTIPNGALASKTITNVGKRPRIRRLLNLGITYDTPPEKLKRALEILKEILADHEGMHPDFPPQVVFNDFGASALNVQVLYWYHPPDWTAYLKFTEQVNLEILRRFNAEGIEFAFPTQTLFLAGDPKRPLRADESGGTP